MLKVVIGYPTPAEEFVVVERMTSPIVATEQVLSLHDLKRYQQEAAQVYADPSVISYAVALVTATRDPESVGRGHLARFLTYGASPRASINLILAARALAYLRGRDFLLPSDVSELAHDVMRHRMVLSYEALAEDLTADDLLSPIIDAVPVPDVVVRGRHASSDSAGPGAPSDAVDDDSAYRPPAFSAPEEMP